jgi:hypothetical protein
MTLTGVWHHHVRILVFALSPTAMAVLLCAAMHVRAVLGMMGAHVQMTLTGVLYRHVRVLVFALNAKAMAVLLWAALHLRAVLGVMGAHV